MMARPCCCVLILVCAVAPPVLGLRATPRRNVLVGAHAIALSTSLPAVSSEPEERVIVSVAVHEKGSPWVYQPNEDMDQCVRCVVARSVTDEPVIISFFPSTALGSVQSYYKANVPRHLHVFEPSLYRGGSSPPPYTSMATGVSAIDSLGLRPGAGVMLGAHGLTVGYGLWASKFISESSDAEHASYGVRGSVAGPLLPGCSDAAVPGPCVLHTTASPAQAAALATQLSDREGGDPRVRDAINLGVIRPPLYSLAAEVVRVDRGYGATANAARLVAAADEREPRTVIDAGTRPQGQQLPVPVGDFPPLRSTREGRAEWA